MDLYHGTNEQAIAHLQTGKIDVTHGGGELGMGFYCGDLLYRAKAWAIQKHNSKKVLVVTIDDDDFLSLDPEYLVKEQAVKIRDQIKVTGTTRTHQFFKNAIWSPVVGIPVDDFNQVKWESSIAQSYLNGPTVKRSTI
jgi:hypothetical protein